MDALCADDFDAVGHRTHGVEGLGFDFKLELRGKACAAHHSQRVIAERVFWLAWGAKHAIHEVSKPVERIDKNLLGQPQRHRVDGEIASKQIGGEVFAKSNLGLAAIYRILVGAIGRDFDLVVANSSADCAKFAPDIPVGIDDRLDYCQNLVWGSRCGEIEVWRVPTEKGVANRATYQGEFVTGRCESFAERDEKWRIDCLL